MTADDDALTWEGDEPDRRLAPRRDSAAVGRRADTVGGRSEQEDDGTVDAPDGRRGTSNAMLVTLGVLGGVFVLFAVGWLIAGLRLASVSQYLVTPAGGTTPPLWQGGTVLAVVLAVAAPLVWCAATLVLTRGSRPWVRIAVLLVGVVLLVPWPFISVGAVGS